MPAPPLGQQQHILGWEFSRFCSTTFGVWLYPLSRATLRCQVLKTTLLPSLSCAARASQPCHLETGSVFSSWLPAIHSPRLSSALQLRERRSFSLPGSLQRQRLNPSTHPERGKVTQFLQGLCLETDQVIPDLLQGLPLQAEGCHSLKIWYPRPTVHLFTAVNSFGGIIHLSLGELGRAPGRAQRGWGQGQGAKCPFTSFQPQPFQDSALLAKGIC